MTTNPKVVHCKRESYDIYIGRPSPFGNPFSHKENTLAEFKVDTREEAVEKYREWFLSHDNYQEVLDYLRGKTLGCWCKPKACHGDVLVELANAPKPKE